MTVRRLLSRHLEATTPHAKELQEARLRVARSANRWTEIPKERLVRRGPYWLVDTQTDCFMPARGVVFQTGSANVIADYNPFFFYVDEDGDVRFLEKTSETWSEMYARRARWEARR